MPNWKKVITSGSQAHLAAVTASSQIIINPVAASTEVSLILGPPPAGGSGEGGQLALQPASGFSSGSFIDTYQTGTTPYIRLLRGTAASSDALVTQWNLHTKQFFLPAYTSVASFSGTAAALLAVNSSGDVITVSTASGGGGGSGTVNGGTAGFLAYYPSTGTTVDDTSGVSWDSGNSRLAVTGSVIATANGAMYFRGGDDAELWDINIANTVGIYGQQDQGVASIKLGSGGGIISGRSGSIGIGTINPTSASLTVNGNVWATSFTGSLQGTATTASYVLNAVSASYAPNTTFPYTGSAIISGSLIVTGSIAQNASTASFGGIVGIGRTPTSSLDVAGTTRLSGSLSTISGSILTVIGSGSAQPIFTVQGSQGELFSITDSLSGSLFSVNDISGLPILEVFSDNTTLIGNYQDPMLITTAKVVQTNSGSFTVYSLPTASYDTAFFEYSIKSGSNARAGTIMAIQSGTSVNFTETTTTDFGSTSAVSFTVIVTGSNIALTGSSTSGAWTTKCIVRGI